MTTQEFQSYFQLHDGCSSHLGVCLKEIGEGYAVASLCISEKNSNFMGAMHGGALATLADVTAGCSLLYRNRACVTMDCAVRYLRGIREGEVTARAKEVHVGKTTAVVQVDITNAQGILCCTATLSMFLTDRPLEAFVQG